MKRYVFACILLALTTGALAKEFTWKNLAILYINEYDYFPDDGYVIDYIREFHPESWNALKEDEFLLEEQKGKYVQELDSRLNAYDKMELYTIRTGVELGKYDFESEMFPVVDGLSENTYFQVQPENIGYFQRDSMSIPSRLKVFFENPHIVSGMAIDKEAAKEFISERKSSSGYIDREVTLILEVRLEGLVDSESDSFMAEIVEAKFDT
ncbi:DUF4852 domain-containing protein [Saccharospirillum salsuginis]|uniref:Uncharacterized protein n=1 Tax=Saccharospirillum salsuginis TaxID=418750 RepID=A0A918NG45_9GAMM|nr:DUF4852 domain-containing protein [Saccharospirillum salsuginis]GGX64987.1 hypothetical protein GCM10007392_36060 [Saccharospirillum salsuginis]